MQDMETAKLYNFEVALFALSTKEPVGVVTISSDIQPPPPFVPPSAQLCNKTSVCLKVINLLVMLYSHQQIQLLEFWKNTNITMNRKNTLMVYLFIFSI